ncbi:hypothetical protein PA7_19490 [Pseudonocardia asaccharolytica DSM 44247 = NBRC 16224]|uniref:Luciferase-like domain-containing protein n=1 Tax=Pseudonocardia asaccharolytica DSM 44247 = NBRC 16224 TaxID=1123024 RepID=A0A511CZZ1_9PSEU|nr:hypothetical protein PA7_19490 [Pseudonocardia asaccharolytica DSM 44247 = NBRC 16224]
MRAEQAGLDSVWTSDHFLPWRHRGGHAPFALAWLAAVIEIKLSYDRDPAAALENCRFWAPLSLTPEQKHSVDSAEEMERLADALPIEQVARRWIVASDPDEAVAQIKPYLDAGLTHLVFHGPGHDQQRFLTQFTADILPRLRTLTSETP